VPEGDSQRSFVGRGLHEYSVGGCAIVSVQLGVPRGVHLLGEFSKTRVVVVVRLEDQLVSQNFH